MLKKITLLLLLILPQTASAQIIMGGTSMKADTEQAMTAIKKAESDIKKNKDVLDRLSDKSMTMNVGEFYYIYPPTPKNETDPWPIANWDSSNDVVLTVELFAPGQTARIRGVMVGETETKWHTLPARPHWWAVIYANNPGTIAVSAWRNADDVKTPPVRTNRMAVLVKSAIPDPVIPKPDNPVTPVTPVGPPADTTLTGKFTATLTDDKKDDAANWAKAADWVETYKAMSTNLSLNDPAVAIKTPAALFQKHKGLWLEKSVPPPPFLKNTRTELASMIATAVGTDPDVTLTDDKRKALSATYLQIYTALKAAAAAVK